MYDTWLSAPYEAAASMDLAFEEYLEEQGVETEDEAEISFEAWLEWKREL